MAWDLQSNIVAMATKLSQHGGYLSIHLLLNKRFGCGVRGLHP